MTEQRPSKEKLLIELRGWHTLKGADCFRQAADEIVRLHEDCRRWENAHQILLAEIERLKRPAHEREGPHCSTCSCPPYPAATGTVLARLRDLRHVAEASGQTVWLSADNILDVLAEIDGRDRRIAELERAAQSPKSGRDADQTSRGSAAPTPRGSLPNSLGASNEPPAVPQSLNEWFCALPAGRQAILASDKWMLAEAAYQAGKASQPPGDG